MYSGLYDSGQVCYRSMRRCSASPRPLCDGTPPASVWPSFRQAPGPYPSDRTPPDASTKNTPAASLHGTSPRIPTRPHPMSAILCREPQTHVRRGAIDASELCRWLSICPLRLTDHKAIINSFNSLATSSTLTRLNSNTLPPLSVSGVRLWWRFEHFVC